MTNNEKKLASKMLELLSDILGKRGCNDFEFPESWSEDEVKSFVKDFHEWNGDPEEFSEDRLYIQDYSVAGLLSEKLKNE